ncbi:hypothetical protein LJB90_01305 [Eubacteriales bacterium OttesenSCG-928-G02]|nr:hypothetical protein [Eubacteriales bacterium OttesenSCG-928-G02]
MDNEKYTTKYEGFLINISMLIIAFIITSIAPFVVRIVLSIFIKTPGMIELKADATYLFNVVYPIVGTITTASFLLCGWYSGYYIGKKVAYQTRVLPNIKQTKMYHAVTGILVYIINMYVGISFMFEGIFGAHLWYYPAILASWFGIFDKSNLLGEVSGRTLAVTNFIIPELTPRFIVIIIIFSLIVFPAMVILSYRGMYAGSKKGIADREEFSRELKS